MKATPERTVADDTTLTPQRVLGRCTEKGLFAGGRRRQNAERIRRAKRHG